MRVHPIRRGGYCVQYAILSYHLYDNFSYNSFNNMKNSRSNDENLCQRAHRAIYCTYCNINCMSSPQPRQITPRLLTFADLPQISDFQNDRLLNAGLYTNVFKYH